MEPAVHTQLLGGILRRQSRVQCGGGGYKWRPLKQHCVGIRQVGSIPICFIFQSSCLGEDLAFAIRGVKIIGEHTGRNAALSLSYVWVGRYHDPGEGLESPALDGQMNLGFSVE